MARISKETRGKIIMGALALIGIAVIAGFMIANRNKDKSDNEDNQANVTTTEDLTALIAGENETWQEVRLINSDTVVYIGGISPEEAADIDSIFRYYEESEGAEITDNELAQIYEQMKPAILEWFDPEFDMVTAFKDKVGTTADTSSIAWVVNPMMQYLVDGNATDYIYFQKDEDGNYHMTISYYMMGYVYSDMVHQFPPAVGND